MLRLFLGKMSVPKYSVLYGNADSARGSSDSIYGWDLSEILDALYYHLIQKYTIRGVQVIRTLIYPCSP